MEYISKVGRIAFGIAILLGLVALPLLFFAGVTRSSEHIIPPLISIGWICVVLVLFVLLPPSTFKNVTSFHRNNNMYIFLYLRTAVLSN